MKALRIALVCITVGALVSGLLLRRAGRSARVARPTVTSLPDGQADGEGSVGTAAWKLEQEARRLEQEILDKNTRADRDLEAAKLAAKPTDTRAEVIRLRRQLADVATAQRLTPAQLNRLSSLMVTGLDSTETDAIVAEMKAAGVADKNNPRFQEFDARLTEAAVAASKKFEAALLAVAGQQTLTELKRFGVTILARDQYDAFVVPAMNAAGIALSPAQADQLLKVLLTETPAAGQYIENNGALRFGYPVASGVSELYCAGRLPETVLQKSTDFLSSQQIEGIRRYASMRQKLAQLTPNVKPPEVPKPMPSE